MALVISNVKLCFIIHPLLNLLVVRIVFKSTRTSDRFRKVESANIDFDSYAAFDAFFASVCSLLTVAVSTYS
jgi:hypothetical protein